MDAYIIGSTYVSFSPLVAVGMNLHCRLTMVHSITRSMEGEFEAILTLSHDLEWYGVTNSRSMWGPSCTCHNNVPNHNMGREEWEAVSH